MLILNAIKNVFKIVSGSNNIPGFLSNSSTILAYPFIVAKVNAVLFNIFTSKFHKIINI